MSIQWLRVASNAVFNMNTGMRATYYLPGKSPLPTLANLSFDLDGQELEVIRGPSAGEVFDYLCAAAFTPKPSEAAPTTTEPFNKLFKES
jgi:hypothetical protein